MKIGNTARLSDVYRRRRHIRKRARITSLGAFILILAGIAIGVAVYFSGRTAVQYVKNFIGPSETADFFESYIEPVVIQDPKPFEDISESDPQWRLKTAIWAALGLEENSARFGLTDDNREILPVDDIKKAYSSLFGENIKPVFKTFSDGKAKYEYSSKEKCFYIPMIALDNVYSPKVTKIDRSGNNVTLTVQYIPGSGWAQNPNGTVSEPPAAKTMLYTLQGGRGIYKVISVKNAQVLTSSDMQSSALASSESTSSGAVSSASASSGASSKSSASSK